MVHDYPRNGVPAQTTGFVDVQLDGELIYSTEFTVAGEDSEIYLFTYDTGTQQVEAL